MIISKGYSNVTIKSLFKDFTISARLDRNNYDLTSLDLWSYCVDPLPLSSNNISGNVRGWSPSWKYVRPNAKSISIDANSVESMDFAIVTVDVTTNQNNFATSVGNNSVVNVVYSGQSLTLDNLNSKTMLMITPLYSPNDTQTALGQHMYSDWSCNISVLESLALPTVTPTPTVTPSPIPTNTPTPTNTPIPTVTPTPTLSPTPTISHTPTITVTITPIPTLTPAPTPLPTNTPTPSPTPTSVPIPVVVAPSSGGGSVVATAPTPTVTPIPTVTATPTVSPIVDEIIDDNLVVKPSVIPANTQLNKIINIMTLPKVNDAQLSKQQEVIANITTEQINQIVEKIPDIKEHWGQDFIAKLNVDVNGNKIINGFPDGSFKPDESVSTEQFITMTVKALGFNPEKDIENWSKPFVDIASQYNLINSDEFKDYSTNITREQMISIIVRAVTLKNKDAPKQIVLNRSKNKIKDYNNISDEYKDDIVFAYSLGITKGMGDGNFAPTNYSTRAQACTMIVKLLEKLI